MEQTLIEGQSDREFVSSFAKGLSVICAFGRETPASPQERHPDQAARQVYRRPGGDIETDRRRANPKYRSPGRQRDHRGHPG